MTTDHALCMWNVFRGPEDYPDRVVVRRCRVVMGAVIADAEPWAICDDIESARRTIPTAGCVRTPRHAEDVPSLVETWF